MTLKNKINRWERRLNILSRALKITRRVFGILSVSGNRFHCYVKCRLGSFPDIYFTWSLIWPRPEKVNNVFELVKSKLYKLKRYLNFSFELQKHSNKKRKKKLLYRRGLYILCRWQLPLPISLDFDICVQIINFWLTG